jgi:hypothetical protein
LMVSLERCPRLGLTFTFFVERALAQTGKYSLLFVLSKEIESSCLYFKHSALILMLLRNLELRLTLWQDMD